MRWWRVPDDCRSRASSVSRGPAGGAERWSRARVPPRAMRAATATRPVSPEASRLGADDRLRRGSWARRVARRQRSWRLDAQPPPGRRRARRDRRCSRANVHVLRRDEPIETNAGEGSPVREAGPRCRRVSGTRHVRRSGTCGGRRGRRRAPCRRCSCPTRRGSKLRAQSRWDLSAPGRRRSRGRACRGTDVNPHTITGRPSSCRFAVTTSATAATPGTRASGVRGATKLGLSRDAAKFHVQPYDADVAARWSRLEANRQTATTPMTPKTAPKMADRTGTVADPRPVRGPSAHRWSRRVSHRRGSQRPSLVLPGFASGTHRGSVARRSECCDEREEQDSDDHRDGLRARTQSNRGARRGRARPGERRQSETAATRLLRRRARSALRRTRSAALGNHPPRCAGAA